MRYENLYLLAEDRGCAIKTRYDTMHHRSIDAAWKWAGCAMVKSMTRVLHIKMKY